VTPAHQRLLEACDETCRRFQTDCFRTTARSAAHRDEQLRRLRGVFRTEVRLLSAHWGELEVWEHVRQAADHCRSAMANIRQAHDRVEREAWAEYNRRSADERSRCRLAMEE
jgi:hypothetical protein